MEENVKLSTYTTFGIGGPAEYFTHIKDEQSLVSAIGFAKEHGLPIHVIGEGSNLLVSDTGVTGLVIKNEINVFSVAEKNDDVFVTAGAGLNFDSLVQKTVENDWWGLENLSGIPGTVGATPIQNVGAYGVEVSSLIKEVRVFDMEKETFVTFANNDCAFSYRDSFFKTQPGRNFCIVSVTYKLSKIAAPSIEYRDLSAYFSENNEVNLTEVRNAVLKIRANKFPDWHKEGTAGSFFKNPIIGSNESLELLKIYPELPTFPVAKGLTKVSLGYILDKLCGLRGYREGEVGLYDKQALVMVNYGKATAEDVKKFAKKITDKVFEKTKIKIEWEVNIL